MQTVKKKPPIYIPPARKKSRKLATTKDNRFLSHGLIGLIQSKKPLILAGGSLFTLLVILLTQNEPVEAYISESNTDKVTRESIPIGFGNLVAAKQEMLTYELGHDQKSQQQHPISLKMMNEDSSKTTDKPSRNKGELEASQNQLSLKVTEHLNKPASTSPETKQIRETITKGLTAQQPNNNLEMAKLDATTKIEATIKKEESRERSINSVLTEEISSKQVANLLKQKQPRQQNNTRPNQIMAKVEEGDSLFKIFKRLNLSTTTLDQIVKSYKSADQTPLRFIYPGQEISFHLDPKTRLLNQLAFNKNALTRIIIKRKNNTFVTEEASNTLKTTKQYAQGVIQDSFYVSAKKSGLSDKTIMEFTDIFAWDIDFTMDLRENDTFDLVYEKNRLINGKEVPGRILSARFTNRGKSVTALSFKNPSNNRISYYDPKGLSLRKAFLRSPVDFARISSHFNLKRKHPILHTIRAHRGVDYAAKRGTPIKATGNGVIKHIGRKSGFGKTVIIQHGKKYNTLYAHMQGYKKALKKGHKVKQGDVIGYIGSSGLATGPHLHYEFRVNNIHKNPLKVKFPDAEPIPKKHLAAFKRSAQKQLSALKNKRTTQLAKANR